MKNIDEVKFQELVEYIHSQLMLKKRRINGDDFLLESKILSVVLANPDMGPRSWSNMLNNDEGLSLTDDDVLQVLRYTYPRLNNPAIRNKIVPLVYETADAFKVAIEKGKEKDYTKFIELRDKLIGLGRYRTVPRLIVLAIFNLCPELNKLGDVEIVYNFRDTVAKYVLFDMCDGLAKYCNTEIKRFVNKHNSDSAIHKKTSGNSTITAQQEKYEIKLNEMEEIVERNRMMLQDIQDEFDEQLQETKVQELTAFFAKLNSDKYGCILDSLLQVRKGVALLKRESFVLPPEISGLFILIQKMTQFVMDNHINPIMKPDSVQEMTAQEAELCDYSGSPYTSRDEKKLIKVVSPGWLYKDKDIRIARPKIQEVVRDDR